MNDIKLPSWVGEWRPGQLDIAEDIVQGYMDGNKFMVLDAPVGSGKTLIAWYVMQRLYQERMALNGTYVCTSKDLQDQFVRDFIECPTLKGRNNYLPQFGAQWGITCADCTKQGTDDDCSWCHDTDNCSYRVVRGECQNSKLFASNTAYFLREVTGARSVCKRPFVIVDEADTLEAVMLEDITVAVSKNQADYLEQRYGLEVPKSGSHRETLMTWINNDLVTAIGRCLKDLRAGMRGKDKQSETYAKLARRVGSWERILESVEFVARTWDEYKDMWVRDNRFQGFALKPTKIDWAMSDRMWKYADYWLLMSGTVLSLAEMKGSLGMGSGEGGVGYATLPMTFEKKNRMVYFPNNTIPVVMKTKDQWPQTVDYIAKIVGMDRYKGERILVHSVNYELTRIVAGGLAEKLDGGGRVVVSYQSAAERADAIKLYETTPGAVMVAPSMERGMDFKDDLCRAIIIAKVPSGYLGNVQISTRLHGEDGQLWYAVQTARRTIQMTGRGVRNQEDYCDTWITDQQFIEFYRRNGGLFPTWWRESLKILSI